MWSQWLFATTDLDVGIPSIIVFVTKFARGHALIIVYDVTTC